MRITKRYDKRNPDKTYAEKIDTVELCTEDD